jgi:hypothetical protein
MMTITGMNMVRETMRIDTLNPLTVGTMPSVWVTDKTTINSN